MYLLIEILFFGVLPVAFAVWQLRDVRREQRRRQQQRQAGPDADPVSRPGPHDPLS